MALTQSESRLAKAAAVRTAKRANRGAMVDRYFELQRQLQRRMSLGMQRELRDELHSVTVHQLGVLMLLRDQSVTMRKLAHELEVGESAATAVVDRLVRQGLVVRKDDPSDRRVVRLALSDTGESLVSKLHDTACKKTAALLAALTYEQLAQLVDIMETLDAAGSTGKAVADEETSRRNTGEKASSR